MWTGKVTRGAVDQLAFSPDGRTLYTRDAAVVRAWDTASHEPTVLMSDAGGYPSNGDLLPTDGVLVVAHGNSLTAVPTGDPATTQRVPASVLSACLLAGGRAVLVGDSECNVLGRTVPGFEPINPPPAFPSGAKLYGRLGATPDGSRVVGLLAVGMEYAITVWDVPTNAAVLAVSRPTMANLLGNMTPSPDGSAVAFGDTTHVVVLDVATGGVRFDVRPGRTNVVRLAWHPNGKLLAAAGDAPAVYFLDTATGKTVAQFDWKIGKIRSLAFSPDGCVCAAGGSSKVVAVWDVDG